MLVSIPAAHPELVIAVALAIFAAAALGASLTVRALGDHAWRSGWDYGPLRGAGPSTELELIVDHEPVPPAKDGSLRRSSAERSSE